jgi:serine protease inhibitor
MMRKSFKGTDRTSSPERVVKYVESSAYKAIRLPYKGCSISAIAVLPNEAAVHKHGIAGAVADLAIDELLDASKYRKVSPAGLDLEMPRFTVKNECMSLSSVSANRHCGCSLQPLKSF